jgi:hypothetical protein
VAVIEAQAEARLVARRAALLALAAQNVAKGGCECRVIKFVFILTTLAFVTINNSQLTVHVKR